MNGIPFFMTISLTTLNLMGAGQLWLLTKILEEVSKNG